MRICYIADPTVHTKRWLKYFADRGYEVHLISSTSRPVGSDDIGNVVLHELKKFPIHIRFVFFPINLLLYVVQIRKLLKKIKPDILHAHYVADCGIWAALTGFHPLILSAWGSDVLVWPHKSRIHRYFLHCALKRATLITTTSSYLTQYIEREFNVSSNKVKVVPWGIDFNIFQKGYLDEIKKLRKSLNIDDGCFTVLSPRHMKELYGIELIIKSIPYIIDKHPNTCFILIEGFAEPAYKDKLKNMIENLGIKKYVRFVSRYLDQQEMAVYYNISDVLMSIPRTDQFGASIVEGMYCGVIPIVSNLEVYGKYLIDGENAFFVDRENPKDIAEKVIYCIEHPELKDRFYEINRKIVEESVDWSKNAPQMERLYLNLLQREQ